MLKATNPNLKTWRYPWTPDLYDWLTDRPNPEHRRMWRFRGKALQGWYQDAYLKPEGSGCRGLYSMVLRCLDSSGHELLPKTNCESELSNYMECMRANKRFTKHFAKEVVPEYRSHLDLHDNGEIKRTSWKQTRNLLTYWYAQPSNSSRTGSGYQSTKRFTRFPKELYTPEAWDKRVSNDNRRSIVKDAIFPHTKYQRGTHPDMENYIKYHSRVNPYTPHAGSAGGVVAPPI